MRIKTLSDRTQIISEFLSTIDSDLNKVHFILEELRDSLPLSYIQNEQFIAVFKLLEDM